MEVWRNIAGYEGYYQVSSLGRVKSLPRGNKKERVRKFHPAPNGYLKLDLSKNNIRETVYVHRLVAEAFIPNPMRFETVNHKNLDKTDNRAENLEWLSTKDNVQHAIANGHCRKRKQVIQSDKQGNIIKIWDSAYEIEKALGFFPTNISKCCRNGIKSYKGYKWRFV